MDITIKELKELLNDKKTSDNKYKLLFRTQLVEMVMSDKDFSYFDIMFKNKKKEEFHCCIHTRDLDKKDTEVLNILKMN